jgi:hypothetical protein
MPDVDGFMHVMVTPIGMTSDIGPLSRMTSMRSLLLLPLTVALFAAQPAKEGTDKPAIGQGVFVAVGYGGFRGWSVDGKNWEAERWSDKNQDDPNIIFSLTYRAGTFLAAGGGVGKGFVLRSTDGKKWEEAVVEKWRIAQVTTTDDRFIATGTDTFLLSQDGVTWVNGGVSKPVSPTEKGSGYFRRHAVAPDGTVVFAGDYAVPGGQPRIGWTGMTRKGETPIQVQTWPSDIRGLTWGAGRFVAAGHLGQVLVSTDGATWKEVLQTGDKHHDSAVRFHAGRFWLKGEKSARVSSDGESWEMAKDAPRVPGATAPDGSLSIDNDWGGVKWSSDGRQWHKATVPIDQTGVCAVAWGVPLANLPPDKPRKNKKK